MQSQLRLAPSAASQLVTIELNRLREDEVHRTAVVGHAWASWMGIRRRTCGAVSSAQRAEQVEVPRATRDDLLAERSDGQVHKPDADRPLRETVAVGDHYVTTCLDRDEGPRWKIANALRQRDVHGLSWKLRRRLWRQGAVECLRTLLPAAMIPTENEIDELFDELIDSPELGEWWCSASAWPPGFQPPARKDVAGVLALPGVGRGRALFLYVAVRLKRPHEVVETGCFSGRDTAVLLQALDRNDEGHLHTIDLPARAGTFSQFGANAGLPEGVSPGFLVPDVLRSRWTLILGDVRDELDPLLRKLGRIDLFFHDSHHSYSHMTWEFATVWSKLAPEGLLVADDISWNAAFWDFARGVGRPIAIHRESRNIGAVSRR